MTLAFPFAVVGSVQRKRQVHLRPTLKIDRMLSFEVGQNLTVFGNLLRQELENVFDVGESRHHVGVRILTCRVFEPRLLLQLPLLIVL